MIVRQAWCYFNKSSRASLVSFFSPTQFGLLTPQIHYYRSSDSIFHSLLKRVSMSTIDKMVGRHQALAVTKHDKWIQCSRSTPLYMLFQAVVVEVAAPRWTKTTKLFRSKVSIQGNGLHSICCELTCIDCCSAIWPPFVLYWTNLALFPPLHPCLYLAILAWPFRSFASLFVPFRFVPFTLSTYYTRSLLAQFRYSRLVDCNISTLSFGAR